MGRSKREILFMIVAGRRKERELQKGLGGRYITTEGKLTSLRSRAAKFETAADAKSFANHREMRLGDRLYIDKRKQD